MKKNNWGNLLVTDLLASVLPIVYLLQYFSTRIDDQWEESFLVFLLVFAAIKWLLTALLFWEGETTKFKYGSRRFVNNVVWALMFSGLLLWHFYLS